MKAALLLLAGAMSLLQPAMSLAQEAGGGELTGFNLGADASGAAFTFGDPKAPPYPVAAGVVPQTQATLSTGPTGYALASVLWPGPLVANAGGIAELVLPLCIPDGDGVCLPKPPPEITNAVDYPARAEAQSPSGDPEVTLPGMRARAVGTESEAVAEVVNASVPDAATVGQAVTTARTALGSEQATSAAHSRVTGIRAAGVISIDSVTTTATAATDGTTSSSQGQTIVEGLEINGQPATIDESGIRLGDESAGSPLAGPVDEVNKQLLSEFGIEMFLTRPVATRDGGTARYRSGSLVIVWQLDERYSIVMSVGGATVVAQASPGSLRGLLDVPDLDFDVGPLPPADFDLSVPGLDGGALPSGGARPVASAPLDRTPDVSLDGERVVFFEGISFGNILIALVGAVLLAAGLRRLAVATADAAPVACPLEARRPE